eukprot:8344326-Prorocentrum_lima.AAC.1
MKEVAQEGPAWDTLTCQQVQVPHVDLFSCASSVTPSATSAPVARPEWGSWGEALESQGGVG